MKSILRSSMLGFSFAILLACGCESRNTVLNTTNYRAKFAQAEQMNLAKPGLLTLNDFDQVLGASYPVDPSAPEFSDLRPMGIGQPGLEWRHWVFQNEYLLIGFAEGKSAKVTRIQR